MLNEEICRLRDKLNESIVTGQDYSVIYQLSIELDELIAEYYRQNKKVMEQKMRTAGKLSYRFQQQRIHTDQHRRMRCFFAALFDII